MKAEYEQRCHELAQDVLLEMGSWREEHPTATLQEIENEVDQPMARMRAGLVEGIAMSSSALEVGSRAAEHPARCPTCGGVLHARQAGAPVADDWRANGTAGAQVWLVPQL